MEGDFTSFGRSFHFYDENKLKSYLRSFIQKAYLEIYSGNYWYKKEKVFGFYIDEDTYYFNLPPISSRPKNLSTNSKKRKHYFNKHHEYYFKKNNDYFDKQINSIIKDIKAGRNTFNSVLLCDNLFENKKPIILSENFATYFDDITALELCNKLSTPFIRSILKNPISNKLEIHRIAMKCYEKYGGHIVSFILSLPKLQFGKSDSKTVITKTKYEGEIPSLKIKFLKHNIEYFLCFYEPRKRIGKETTVASLFNKTQTKIEGFLTYSGYIEHRINNESISLKFFIENVDNKQLVSCSVEPGRCINCNKELTDTSSLKVGYGRNCAKELGIPYT